MTAGGITRTAAHMNKNVEIKARVSGFDSIVEQVREIANEGPAVIEQEDTFFHTPRGRLKLRKFSDSHGELIYYDRPDTIQPKTCHYVLSPCSDPDSLRNALSHAFGIRGVVRKRRVLYIVGQSRIHLDEVEGLGYFIEIEVVLKSGQSTTEGVRIAGDLMATFGIDDSSLVDRAYIDLLLERTREINGEVDSKG